MPILFYTTRDTYGGFSNFSRHSVNIYDRTWPTSEHAFQAQKFHPHRPDLVEAVRQAASPRVAASMGRDRQFPLAAGWDEPVEHLDLNERLPDYPLLECFNALIHPRPLFAALKDVVMYEVVYAKIAQHGALWELLLGTGTQEIIEASPVDSYWGWGADEKGENKLGRIFMAIRMALRESKRINSVFGKPSCLAV